MIKKKIEWQGNIADSVDDSPVKIQNADKQIPVSTEPKDISGKCALRVEKKGRGGSPAIILFNFSDPEAKHLSSLKKLCSQLKVKLACGGTVQMNEILLTLQDTEKVKKILLKFFNISI